MGVMVFQVGFQNAQTGIQDPLHRNGNLGLGGIGLRTAIYRLLALCFVGRERKNFGFSFIGSGDGLT